jgi:hypothetical protein
MLTVFSSVLLSFASHLLARLFDRLRNSVSKDGLDLFERFILRFWVEAVADQMQSRDIMLPYTHK